MTPDSPLDQLARLVTSVLNTGDPSPLLSAEASAAASEVSDGHDHAPASSLLVGLFHWYRGYALPADSAGPELAKALDAFAGVTGDIRGAIPDEAVAASQGDAYMPSASAPSGGNSTDGDDDEVPGDAETWNQLGGILLIYAHRVNSVPDLTRALALMRGAVALAPADAPVRRFCLSNLAIGHQYRARLTNAVEDYDAAVRAASAAVEVVPPGDDALADMLGGRGNASSARFERTGAMADLAAAIEDYRAALAATSNDDPERGGRFASLGDALRDRYEQTGDAGDLAAAIEACQEGAAIIPEDHRDRAACLNDLGLALRARFERFGDTSDLDAAVKACREALASVPDGHPDRLAWLSNLASVLQSRADATGGSADLDEAVSLGELAVADSAGHPQHAAALSNLGAALHTRFRRRGERRDLDAAIAAARASVEATPAGLLDRSGRLSNLGNALLSRFELDGTPADLDLAVQASRDALDTISPDHPGRAGCENNLGNVLKLRFQNSGRMADLDESIEHGRAAVRSIPEGHQDRCIYLSNLGNSLQTRFEAIGASTDLDQAVAACGEAARAARNSAERSGYLANFGVALITRFERGGSRADLSAAIDTDREAAALAAPNSLQRAVLLSNLGLALRHRFTVGGDMADIDEAIATTRQAIALLPTSNPHRAMCLSNLGLALLDRFEKYADASDINSSIEAATASTAEVTAEDPRRCGYLVNLGNSLFSRYESAGHLADLTAGGRHWRAAAELDAAPTWQRCAAARQWGMAAARAEDWASAAAAYTLAIGLLNRVVDRSLQRADQEFQLGRFSALAMDAAAASLQCGAPERALTVLEQGRGVLLTQALQARTGLERLSEQRPDLADRLIFVDDELGKAPLEQLSSTELYSAVGDYEHRRALLWERGQLVAEIRDVPGFKDFQLAPDVAQLMGAASRWPVVAVNVSGERCDALAVSAQGIGLVSLPGLTIESATDYAERLRSATDLRQGGTRREMLDILAWLWDVVVGPVLDVLGFNVVPGPGKTWPRMWWLPTGPLTFMPLHAAGHPGGPSALDCVISSYTPTIGALNMAQARPAARAPGPDTLVVGVRHATEPGFPDLLDAPLEAGDIAAIAGTNLVLIDQDATSGRVIGALRAARTVHFACHAVHDAHDPSRSRILLVDGPLTVADISRQRLTDVDLAYLSACSTAQGGIELTDEVLHPASAFHLAGYSHVIGSLWQIPDDIARDIASQVYSCIIGSPRTPDIARAVHATTRRQRDSEGDTRNPRLWSAMVHIGP
jgi:tetratricopeptide (TPR) repeat protein